VTAVHAVTGQAFCMEILPKVSRTFAVCIRLLPAELERPVLVAYLLCRIADTFEDTTRLPVERRVKLLARFSNALDDETSTAAELRDAFADPETDEELLVREAGVVLGEYWDLTAAQRDAIRPWVQEMCTGMAEFVRRENSGKGLEALSTVEELDRYCYYVAGTVGPLLTALFTVHYRLGRGPRFAKLESLATSFGLGLQLTNIIKDVGDDQRRGWSFVPRQLCETAGIQPEDLQDGEHGREGRRVMQMLIDKAKGHLRDALEYATALPRRDSGVRQFCLTSLYFAVQTLRLAEQDDRLLDPNHKVKITRTDVFRTVRMTRVVAPSNVLVRLYFRILAGREWNHGPSQPVPSPTG
jgi:farnesyl-diphosphate farnesyltransferase